MPPPEIFESVQEETVKLLRRPPRLSAPGLLGCRLEHLGGAKLCAETMGWLSEAISWIAFGMLPGEALAVLRTGEVTALRKADDSVRPLIVGSTVRRLSLRALAQVRRSSSGTQPGTGSTGSGGPAAPSSCCGNWRPRQKPGRQQCS